LSASLNEMVKRFDGLARKYEIREKKSIEMVRVSYLSFAKPSIAEW
jgi:hypothetical protein